jgi:hypothetical protein
LSPFKVLTLVLSGALGVYVITANFGLFQIGDKEIPLPIQKEEMLQDTP